MSQEERCFAHPAGWEEPVDITDLVRDVLDECEAKHDFTPQELAQLAEDVLCGDPIPKEFFSRIEGGDLYPLIGKLWKWIVCVRRISQVSAPDVQYVLPFIQLTHFDYPPPCAESLHLRNRWLEPEDLVRLPVKGCQSTGCNCTYVTRSVRRVLREGDPGWQWPKAAVNRVHPRNRER